MQVGVTGDILLTNGSASVGTIWLKLEKLLDIIILIGSKTMKLISEHFSDDVEYITEQDDDGKKNYKLKGVFHAI